MGVLRRASPILSGASHLEDTMQPEPANEAVKPRRLLQGYLEEGEACIATKKTQRTLGEWRERRTGPPFVNIGKTVYYPEAEF